MRVLLDCRMASWSGIGRYSTGLARALATVPGIEIVQVVDRGARPPVPDAEAIPARLHAFYPTAGIELGRIAARVRPDVTHCLHVPTPIPARHPLAVTIHDLTPLVIPEVMPSALRRAAYRWWNMRAASVADVILANSAATASDIERIFPRAAGHVRVVLHAADDFASVAPSALPPGLADGGPYLLSMGNTKVHKDLPTLLRAFERLAPTSPGLRLLLVGRDQPGYVATVLSDAPRIAARVRFTGHVDDSTLRALYEGASAFVFPSRYEGFGLPPLEAMIAGTPVVCANAASLPEVVGDAALLFSVGDAVAAAAAISSVLFDDGLRARLVAAGRERARLFTWERTARETVEAYHAILDRS